MTNSVNTIQMDLKIIKATVLGVMAVNIVGLCMMVNFYQTRPMPEENAIETTEVVELSEYPETTEAIELSEHPVIDFAPCLEGDNPDVTEEDWANSGCLKRMGKTLKEMRGF